MELYFQMHKKKGEEKSEEQKFISWEEFWNTLTQLSKGGNPPVSKKFLRELKVHFVKKEEEGKELCTICLNKYKKDEQTFILPKCKHQYHRNCLRDWFLKHNSCPLCRNEFITDDPDYEIGKLDEEKKKESKKEALNSMYM